MPRILLAVLVLSAAAMGQDYGTVLTGVEKTAHFEIRFRRGSHAEASVDRVSALVEGELQLILRELGLDRFRHTIKLWLYDDVAELQRITGVPSGGHSTTLESHVPHDNDQTRLHELVHVVAEMLTEKGDEPRNLFFAEGLANAVLRFVSGVPVHAVAAFHMQRGELPSLADMHALPDFYAWQGAHPGINGYDVAGSYLRWLLDTHGAAKVRRYYKGVAAKVAFGADLAALDKGWRAHLATIRLRPGLLALLEERSVRGSNPHHAARAKVADAILGPASEWKELPAAERKGEPCSVEAGALLLSGAKSQGDWCVARVGPEGVGDAMVRAVAEPLAGCYGVQIQVGNQCQGMVLRGQGAFVYSADRGVGHKPGVPLGDKVEIVLRRQGGKASVWIDGVLVAEGPVDGTPGDIGVGCVGGKARFRGVAWRRL
jgi:hypothetical protein